MKKIIPYLNNIRDKCSSLWRDAYYMDWDIEASLNCCAWKPFPPDVGQTWFSKVGSMSQVWYTTLFMLRVDPKRIFNPRLESLVVVWNFGVWPTLLGAQYSSTLTCLTNFSFSLICIEKVEVVIPSNLYPYPRR